MRHNQNGRRFRGRNNNTHSGSGHNHNRRINPRVHTFDSNGPDVRIRGNAMQINEKYLTLARDAHAGGDRVLAESYLQHAEHYQRLLNELTEEQNRYQQQNPQHNPQQPNGRQNGDEQDGNTLNNGSGDQPVVPLEDLDQGFLVGNRNGTAAPQAAEGADSATDEENMPQARNNARRSVGRQKTVETA